MNSEMVVPDTGLQVGGEGVGDAVKGAASGVSTAASHGGVASTVAAPNGAAHGVPAANADVGAPDASAALRPLDLLHKVEMAVTVELGRTRILVRDLLRLQVGSIVELDRPVGGPVDVMVNGTLLARGEVVVVDDELGVRITEVVSSTGDR